MLSENIKNRPYMELLIKFNCC